MRPSSHFKKKAIPQASRIALAVRYGCPPGYTVEAKCKCGEIGQVVWNKNYHGKPTRWVTFPRLEIDHVKPEFLGGTGTPENLQLLCRRCNRSKGWRK